MINNLRAIRKAKGMTQNDLAEAAHINRVSIARYETGKHQPGLANATKLANALGVTVDELIGKEE